MAQASRGDASQFLLQQRQMKRFRENAIHARGHAESEGLGINVGRGVGVDADPPKNVVSNLKRLTDRRMESPRSA